MENEITMNEGEVLEYVDQIENDEVQQTDDVDSNTGDAGHGYNGNGLSGEFEFDELLPNYDEIETNGESDTVSEGFDINELAQGLLAYQGNAETDEIVYSFWNKPFDEYSVSEGYLLLIFILLLWLVISRHIGGVFK